MRIELDTNKEEIKFIEGRWEEIEPVLTLFPEFILIDERHLIRFSEAPSYFPYLTKEELPFMPIIVQPYYPGDNTIGPNT